MNTTAETCEEALERVCSTIIAEKASTVDKEGSFPAESVGALCAAGLLGAMSSDEVGGLNLGLKGAARIVGRVAEECGSTAMVLTMHYCGVAVLEAHAAADVRRQAASGAHSSTLAFSEAGSRSHFWAPLSTAESRDGNIALNASKSWVTSASHATAYVWSSRPLAAEGLSTIWLVPASARACRSGAHSKDLGLRGNDSRAVSPRIPSRCRSRRCWGPTGKASTS